MTVERREDGLGLHLRVPEPQPGVREERGHPQEATLRHLLRAQDGADERRGGGGQTTGIYPGQSLISRELNSNEIRHLSYAIKNQLKTLRSY